MQGTRWIFTIKSGEFQTEKVDVSKIKYIVFQLEKGEGENHFEHYQGYMVLKSNHKLPGVKKILACDSAHLEVCHGTHDQCIAYCTKEETRIAGPWEHGDSKACGQGKRNDVSAALEHLQQGGVKRLLSEMPEFVLSHGAKVQKYIEIKSMYDAAAKEYREISVIFVHGPTGLRKTSKIYEYFGEQLYGLFKTNNAWWWQGYVGEKVLLIDDLTPGLMSEDMALQYLQGHPLITPTKGGSVRPLYNLVFLTSNWSFYDLWRDPHGAIKRRIEIFVHCENQDWMKDLLTDVKKNRGCLHPLFWYLNAEHQNDYIDPSPVPLERQPTELDDTPSFNIKFLED